MSYAVLSLRRVHAMAPGLPTVLLMDRVPLRFRDGRLPPRIRNVGIELETLKAYPRTVERFHAQGNLVHCFTVDEPADIDYVLSLGVDVVISNRPAAVREQLHRKSSR
jgi:glycerophosphoryl diester phosphodiesterase